MAIITTSKLDTFDSWRLKTNEIASQLGDNALLGANGTLTTTTAVDAILEVLDKVETEVGVISALTTTAPTLVGAINEHDAEIGVISTLTTSAKNTIVASINELDADIGDRTSLTTTAKTNLISAVNELDAELGTLTDLDTTAQTTFVDSINEIVERETDRYNNTLKLDLTDATVGGTNNSTQTILSNLALPTGKTFTIDGTLDISEGSLTVGGGSNAKLNINTTYIGLGDTTTQNPPTGGGIIINRGTDYGLPGEADDVLRPDVRVYWDENDNRWYVKRLDDQGSAINAYILDNTNLEDVITGGSQSGITVTYQTTDSTLDFDVNDFTITLTGDVTGTGTVTNLGNVSIATTVEPNMVALGTDTTGAYVKSISLDASNPGISFTSTAGTGGESNDITVLKVDTTVIRTSGAQSMTGVKTFSDVPVFSTGFESKGNSSVTGSLSVSTDLTVSGNLTVSGTTTTVNTEEIKLADNIIVLNSNATGAASENAGIEVERGTDTNVSVLWNESDDVWTINNGTTTYNLVGKVQLDNATTPVVQVNTTLNSNSAYCSDISNVEIGDYIINHSAVPADTFVIGITPGTGVSGTITLSKNATAGASDTTVNFVKAPGLQVASDKQTVTLQHYTPVSVARDTANTNGTVIRNVTFDQFGHVMSTSAYDLDNRYYTETESDTKFVSTAGGSSIDGNVTATKFIGDLQGNADTATKAGKWSTTRTIKVSGDVTSDAVNIDGSGNIEITNTVVGDDSHNHTASTITDFNTKVTEKVANLWSTATLNGINISYNTNTSKLEADVNDFNIKLTGFVTGNADCNNLGDVSISTSIDSTNTDFISAVKALMPKIYNVSGSQVFPTT